MADEVLYPQTIEPTPLPNSTGGFDQPTQTTGQQRSSTGEVITPNTVDPVKFPEKYIAPAVISDSINTQTKQILGQFTFGQSGALAIGTYENGVSGDVRITPTGIVARDVNGDETFTLDGATGDAAFKGTVQAGSLISGAVNVGAAQVVIDGANTRIVVYDESANPIILIGKQVGGF